MSQGLRVRALMAALFTLLVAGALLAVYDNASAGSMATTCQTYASPDAATRRPAALHAYDDFIEDVLG